MKITKLISKKLIAFILVATCVFSTTTVAITSTSALTASSVLEKTKSYNDLIYGAFSDSLKSFTKFAPFISVGLDMAIDLFNGLINEDEEGKSVDISQSLDDIKKGIEDIKSDLADISFMQKMQQNESFNESIDDIRNKIEKCNDSITELAESTSKLNDKAKELKEGTISKEEFSKESKTHTETLETVKKEIYENINSAYMLDLTSISKQLINEVTLDTKKQPFKNYFDAILTDKDVSFGQVAKDKASKYENKVMSIYTSAISTYCIVEAMKIDDAQKEDNQGNVLHYKRDLAMNIIGTQNDSVNINVKDEKGKTIETKSVNVWKDGEKDDKTGEVSKHLTDEYKKTGIYKKTLTYAFDYYDNEVLSYEKSKIKNYYYDNGKKNFNIDSVQPCKIYNAEVLSTKESGIIDQKMFNTLAGVSNTYYEPLTALKDYIEENYIKNSCNHKKTLKSFLVSKGIEFGNNIDEDALLLVGTMNNVKNNDVRQIQAIKINETDANFEKIILIYRPNSDKTRTTSSIRERLITCNEKLCTFISEPQDLNNIVAEVTKSGQTYKYSSFEDAWSTVESNGGTIKLLQDWTAKKYGEEKFTRFSENDCVGIKNGGLYINGSQEKVSRKIEIDLNNHKIDRAMSKNEAYSSGSVITIDRNDSKIVELNIYNSASSSENALITGGSTTGNGGGICNYDSDKLRLSNIQIKNNYASNRGGGVYVTDDTAYLYLSNCNIENNEVGSDGGGIFATGSNCSVCDITLWGQVNIQNNTCNGNANNATLDDTWATKAVFKIAGNWNGFKNSHIGVNSTTGQKSIDITAGYEELKDCRGVFTADQSNRHINIYETKKWFCHDHYAEIVRN